MLGEQSARMEHLLEWSRDKRSYIEYLIFPEVKVILVFYVSGVLDFYLDKSEVCSQLIEGVQEGGYVTLAHFGIVMTSRELHSVKVASHCVEVGCVGKQVLINDRAVVLRHWRRSCCIYLFHAKRKHEDQ